MKEARFWRFLEGVLWEVHGREPMMMILAHNGSDAALGALTMYNMRSDKGLEVFSCMALEECKDWRNATVMKVDLV